VRCHGKCGATFYGLRVSGLGSHVSGLGSYVIGGVRVATQRVCA